ncbi:hypothetical protein [Alteribacter keqinensis]|uniref:Uncharacterized protein n=1 Tax=Alteribacter keqinensis TaxID=2483800 RepID=A0A3M7TUX6_9BACI|nr:hypothetical protein [Alteribacter keqinensis]RNA68802.1 hypothetical protein EBO34_02220 [Alteribacter keqinensis]
MSRVNEEPDFEDLVYELERQNYIRKLPNQEREVYEYVVSIDVKTAKESSDLAEYLRKSEEKTPIEKAAEHFNLNPFQVRDIVRNVQDKLFGIR